MTPQRWQQIKSVYYAALDAPAEQRSSFVQERCLDDAALRDEVERLLRHRENSSAFLETFDPDRAPATPIRSRVAEGPGARIGAYRLIKQLGEGGFGTVYLAEQERPIRRKVALKVVKAGMDTRQVISRFQQERQALALMDHPHIAHVYDAGETSAGRPYFVMEHVAGAPITEYCDRQRRNVPERLTLFMSVCEAVQHAHQKGIIHRDLKPSNVLVESVAGCATPKVIDFGVARAAAADLYDRSVFTMDGQFIGTPAYMSPEQADPICRDIDTRSDVYALGVMLYELLTGTTPFDAKRLLSGGHAELQRIIREVEPEKPSTRVSALRGNTGPADGSAAKASGSPAPQQGAPRGAASSAIDIAELARSSAGREPVAIQPTEIAAHRRTDPKTLARLMRGDLDWIAMKCLEKDRSRRYASASALAADVRRYLNHEPVVAGPPGAGYRLRKFVRRNRVVVTAAALVLGAIVAGAATTAWQAVAATDARDRALAAEKLAENRLHESEKARTAAQTEEAIATAINDFLNQDLLSSIDPQNARGRDVSVREVLDNAARTISGKFSGQPMVEAGIRTTLGKTYLAIGQHELAEPHLLRAMELCAHARGVEDLAAIVALSDLGTLRMEQGRYAEAESLMLRAVEGARSRLEPADPDRLAAINNLAALYQRQGRSREAALLFEEVVEENQRRYDAADVRVVQPLGNLAAAYASQGRFSEAEPLFERALERNSEFHGQDHPSTLNAIDNLAQLRLAQARFDDAEQLQRQALEGRRRVLGENHPHTLTSEFKLAELRSAQGRRQEAAQLVNALLETQKQVLGEDHPDTLLSMDRLATLYAESGRLAEAAGVQSAAYEGRRRILGEEAEATLVSMDNLAGIYGDQGNYAEAERLYRRALEAKRRVLGPLHKETQVSMNNLAWLLRLQGRFDEAEPLYAQVVDLARRLFGDDHPETFTAIACLALIYGDLRRYSEAEPLYAQAIAGQRRLLGDEHPDTLQTMANQATLYANQGRYTEAEPLMRAIWEAGRRVQGDEHPTTLAAMINLATVQQNQGRLADAQRLYSAGLTILRRLLGNEHPETLQAAHGLALVLHKQKRWAEAEPLFKEVITNVRRIRGSEDPLLLQSLGNLATLYQSQDRFAEADAVFREAIEGTRQFLDGKGARLGMLLAAHGRRLSAQQQFDEAESRLVEARGVLVSEFGEAHEQVRRVTNDLIALYESTARPNKAAEWHAKLADDANSIGEHTGP